MTSRVGHAIRVGIALLALAAVAYVVMFARARAETGIASYYSYESGARRADGHRFRPLEVTCAHRRLPFGTVVRVTDRDTGRSIRCPIADRGPFIRGRIIDLSLGAARALGIVGRGIAHVRVSVER